MFIFEMFSQFPSSFPVLETIISAVVAYGLGVFWYHPKVMGEKWAAAHEGGHGIKTGPLVYIVGALLWLITSSVYSFIATFLTPPEIGSLLGLSTFLWVGFVLPNHIINGFFNNHKLMVCAVDSSYYLAGFYLFAVIHDVL